MQGMIHEDKLMKNKRAMTRITEGGESAIEKKRSLLRIRDDGFTITRGGEDSIEKKRLLLRIRDDGFIGDIHVHLPNDVWAYIMEFLPYRDIMQNGAISRHFLYEIAPLIRRLEICKESELRVAWTNRLFGVTEINVNCLVTRREDGAQLLCKATAERLVHFLSRFPNLARIWVGGVDYTDNSWNDYFNYDVRYCITDGHEEIFRALIKSFCEAYRAGIFPSSLSLDGIISTGADDDYQLAYYCPGDCTACELCEDVCRSFPLDWVTKLRQKKENDGDVCLPIRNRIAIIANRPGGANFLASPFAISCCVAKRYARDFVQFRMEHQATPCCYGCFSAIAIDLSSDILNEIEVILEYGRLDPRTVQYEDIVKEYWRNSDHNLPTRKSCFMTKHTFEALTQLGFSAITAQDFNICDCKACNVWRENHPL